MTTDPADHESLLQFVYQIPVGVAQLAPDGELGMTNPVAMQLVLQVSPGELNLFRMLERYAPEVELLFREFEARRGTVLEDYRVDFGLRSSMASHPLVIAFTITKLSPEQSVVTMVDVSRSVAAERSARSAESRLRALVETVRDYAVFGLDPEGRIVDWNVSAQRLFAFAPSDALEKPLRWLADDPDHAISGLFERAQRVGWATAQATWRRQDCVFSGTANISVLEGEDGKLEGYTCIVRDQSETACGGLPQRSEDRDPETGTLSRQALHRVEARLLAGLRRTRDPLALVLLDIDGFERLAARVDGETAADAVRSVVGGAQEHLRTSDPVVRYQTSRLLLLLPSTDLWAARSTAERLRAAQERRVLETDAALVKLTLSAGVTQVEPSEPSLDLAIERATRALDTAHERGDNQVVVTHPPRAARAG